MNTTGKAQRLEDVPQSDVRVGYQDVYSSRRITRELSRWTRL